VTTEQEPKKKDESRDHAPGLPPPARPEDLPEEDRKQYFPDYDPERRDPGFTGDFTGMREARLENMQQEEQEGRTFDESAAGEPEDRSVAWFQHKSTESMKYWAQFTQFKIKMDDGSFRVYDRVPITKYQANEIFDLHAEIQSLRSIDYEEDAKGRVIAGKKLSPTEARRKQNLLDQLKAKYYLRNAKTGEPMSATELLHVADSTIIDGILEACTGITLAKWAEGKK